MQEETIEAMPPPLHPGETSLFLDFDGTLVVLANQPDEVVVSPRLKSLLSLVAARLSGRIAIVSGRSVAQLDQLLGATASELALVGSHGAEIRTTGAKIVAPERPPSLKDAEAVFKATFAAKSGVIIEVKSLGVAIHYRLDPLAGEAAALAAEDFCSRTGLELQKGKMMVEVRMPGYDKGSGIAALMSTAPFQGHMPIFVGDDVTDEAGFAWCEASGGAGVLVGPPRATAARYSLPDVAAVHSWLEQA